MIFGRNSRGAASSRGYCGSADSDSKIAVRLESRGVRTFSLPSEQAGYIDNLVASGSYASGSEVVRAGLRALQERDAAAENWLREEVIGVCGAMKSDPSRAVPGEQVFATIRARHADRIKKGHEPQD